MPVNEAVLRLDRREAHFINFDGDAPKSENPKAHPLYSRTRSRKGQSKTEADRGYLDELAAILYETEQIQGAIQAPKKRDFVKYLEQHHAVTAAKAGRL